ncbi:cytochrome P450 [Favolaschia claudopus]|uniref:Cytochrome P450 n=1 Tax=Favolaschia claudopus TaxID=2862362 RepID=A0AAW0DYX3_9AGAR
MLFKSLPLSLELGLGIVFVLVYRELYNRARDRRPPGPRGLPILGNILQIRKLPWVKFANWAQTYGPVFRLNIAGQDMIILNNNKTAADLLDRRSVMYSDRPRNIVARMLTGDMVFTFAQVGSQWRRMRRAAHDALGPQVAKNYHPLQEREAVVLVEQMLQAPEQFDDHIKRASASLVMAIIYGTPIMESDDRRVDEIQKHVARTLASLAPGAFLVEYLPFMEKLPRWMSGWRRYAEHWYKVDSAMLTGFFYDTKTRKESGDDGPSVAATLLDAMGSDGLPMLDAAWLSAALYAAGAETSSGQMEWFMMAMLLHPEAQKIAQRQIDEVVGRGRMPTFADYDQLPYVRAVVKEVLRWRPVLPLGIPHRLSQDDWYEGHYIPKDSVVISNVWGLNHDPEVYGDDADFFRPERHLNDNGDLSVPLRDTKDEGHFAYGFGKRICIGRHVANRSLFIEAAAVLWSFNIEPVKDADGSPVIPEPRPFREDSLALRPAPFPCNITPRSNDVAAIVAHTKHIVVDN